MAPPPGCPSLPRGDGAVLVPAEAAPEVLRALMRDTSARQRRDGGTVSAAFLALLYALHRAQDPRGDPGCSPTGSRQAQAATVVTVSQAATVLECSPRWVRYLITAGRLDATQRGPGCPWLINQSSLENYRRPAP